MCIAIISLWKVRTSFSIFCMHGIVPSHVDKDIPQTPPQKSYWRICSPHILCAKLTLHTINILSPILCCNTTESCKDDFFRVGMTMMTYIAMVWLQGYRSFCYERWCRRQRNTNNNVERDHFCIVNISLWYVIGFYRPWRYSDDYLYTNVSMMMICCVTVCRGRIIPLKWMSLSWWWYIFLRYAANIYPSRWKMLVLHRNPQFS